MARVRLDRGQLNRTLRGVSRSRGETAARQTLNLAKVYAPVDTGRLRASGSIRRRSFLGFRSRWTISFDVDYAEAVHDGTRPHIIRPRRAKALRFRMGGRIVYAKFVRHPGTRARPFLDRALREVAARLGFSYRQG